MACSDKESGAISPPLRQYLIAVFQHQSCHHIHTAVERCILDLAVLPLHDIYVSVRSDENSGGCTLINVGIACVFLFCVLIVCFNRKQFYHTIRTW